MRLISVVVASMIILCAAVAHASATTITFAGRYEYRTDAESLEVLGEQVCFFPSKASSVNVPRPPGDSRLPWFCFTDSRQAAHLLGFALNVPSKECGFKGEAKVTVSNYKRYAGEGDGNDVAILVDVLEKLKPRSLPCGK